MINLDTKTDSHKTQKTNFLEKMEKPSLTSIKKKIVHQAHQEGVPDA